MTWAMRTTTAISRCGWNSANYNFKTVWFSRWTEFNNSKLKWWLSVDIIQIIWRWWNLNEQLCMNYKSILIRIHLFWDSVISKFKHNQNDSTIENSLEYHPLVFHKMKNACAQGINRFPFYLYINRFKVNEFN